jgi:transmembrane sensor
MSTPRTLNRTEIDRQASVWTARLETGALTDADRRELAAWLDAEPEHRWALSRYREMCAQLAEQVPVLTDAEEVDALVASVTARRRWTRFATGALAAAASVALAVGAWRMLPEKVGTHSAERRALVLADGSRLELNAQTSLEISRGGGERRVKLLRGETLFRVAPDAARPFLVETAAGTVRVTGTAFNVRGTAAGAVEVTVLEGTVQARPAAAGAPVPLAIGAQAVLTPEQCDVRQLSPDEVQNTVAWRVGQAAFESEPLAEALERFRAYHGRKVTVAPAVAALRVGGRYSLDDLDGFLAAIEQALPVRVEHGAAGAVNVVSRPRARR